MALEEHFVCGVARGPGATSPLLGMKTSSCRHRRVPVMASVNHASP